MGPVSPTTRDILHRKRIHLAVRLPAGVDHATLSDLARTAERGCFDFVVGTGGLAVLAALAAVTRRLGLVGTVDTSVTEPFEAARQLATLDHLSDGRVGWSAAPSSGEVTDPYGRADEFASVAQRFWDCWRADAIAADADTGVYVDPDRVHPVSFRGAHFTVDGLPGLPAGPQGRPVLLQAGESTEDRAFAVRRADVIVAPHTELDAATTHYANVKAEVTAHGRDPDRVRVLTALTPHGFVGAPERVAADIDLYVQSDACDGVLLAPPPTSDGLDAFVAEVVPLLRDRGVFRTSYEGATLRQHLGLAELTPAT